MHRTFLAATLAAALLSTTPVFEPLWRFLGTLWGEEGCMIDPHGQCNAVLAPTTDSGCKIDPNGRCAELSAPTTDSGCKLDPYGLCTPGS